MAPSFAEDCAEYTAVAMVSIVSIGSDAAAKDVERNPMLTLTETPLTVDTKLWYEVSWPLTPPAAFAASLKAPTIFPVIPGSWNVTEVGPMDGVAMVAG